MFLVRIKPEVLASLRKQYPASCVMDLVEMRDPYRDMPAGMTEKVIHVDNAGAFMWHGATAHPLPCFTALTESDE